MTTTTTASGTSHAAVPPVPMEVALPLPGPRPEVAAALAHAAGDRPHVVYEDEHVTRVALDVRAELVVDHEAVHLTVDGHRRVQRWTGRPLPVVERMLAHLPEPGWRAYGVAAFELARAEAGGAMTPAEGPLLHLIIPRTEVTLTDEQALVRSTDPAALDRTAALIAAWRPAAAASGRPGTPVSAPIEHADADRYLRSVDEGIAAIRAGAVQKLILSRRVPITDPVSFPATYVAGRAGNTPARSFLLRLGGLRMVGFSPEIVLEVEADGQARLQPLAGTCALPDDAEAAAGLRSTLLGSRKEVFEHAISVQVAQDELRAVCTPGSVVINDFMGVAERGSVQHIASGVTGTLRGDVGPWEALGRLFPSVTASGVPKPAACALIRELEGRDRGPYAGAVLCVEDGGRLDAALVLRAAYERDGCRWLQAGAGIVAESVPEREVEETREKLRSIAPYVMRQ
jgi:salicylate synthetase